MNELDRWLQSKACIPIIDTCVKQLFFSSTLNAKSNRDLIKDALGIGVDELSVEFIISEFWAYLKEKPKQIDFIQDILNEDITKFMNKISLKFINYLIDERRERVPWRRYYQHLRRILSEELKNKRPNFTYKAIKGRAKSQYTGKSYYAFSGEKNLPIATPDLWGPHENSNYKDWNVAKDASNLTETINNKDTMLFLAEHFWNCSVEIFKGKHLLPIQQLTNYVFTNYIIEGREIEYPAYEDNDRQVEFEDKEVLHITDYRLLAKRVEELADTLVHGWNRSQKVIFLKRYKDRMTLQDIERSGHKSANYNLNKIENSIKEQWSLWGFLDVSDDDREELFLHFHQKVIEFCEKAVGTVGS